MYHTKNFMWMLKTLYMSGIVSSIAGGKVYNACTT